MKKSMLIAIALTIFGCANAADKSGFYKGYETPEYKIVKTINNVEIREYPSTLVAKVSVTGERDDAANKGFRILAGYIFGNNLSDSKIAMTSPVKQSPENNKSGMKIAMTSPVLQTQTNQNKWEIEFGMPREYSIKDLPKPNDDRIKFEQTKPIKLAAIKFSGFWSDSEFAEKKAELLNTLDKNKIKIYGNPSFAYYDSPFTLPWNRRNEILVEIK